MKYLCLVYLEEKKLDALSESEMHALVRESLAIPPARLGCVEVRPIRELTRQ